MKSFRKKKEFRRLYAEYYPVVLSAVFCKTGNREDAEDICHEVFIRFLMNYDDIVKHRGWLMTAIKFEVANYYRRKRNRGGGDADIDDFSEDENLAYVNGFRDSRIMLQEAIENEDNFDNEREMILFHLIAVYDFSFTEAGEYLGMTKWQTEHEYKKISKRLMLYFKEKGIKGIEDLL